MEAVGAVEVGSGLTPEKLLEPWRGVGTKVEAVGAAEVVTLASEVEAWEAACLEDAFEEP